jgi:hypothetical protein
MRPSRWCVQDLVVSQECVAAKKRKNPLRSSPLFTQICALLYGGKALDKVFVPRGQRAGDVTFVTAVEVD